MTLIGVTWKCDQCGLIEETASLAMPEGWVIRQNNDYCKACAWDQEEE